MALPRLRCLRRGKPRLYPYANLVYSDPIRIP
jgi:hypothetical protein